VSLQIETDGFSVRRTRTPWMLKYTMDDVVKAALTSDWNNLSVEGRVAVLVENLIRM
jgi:hypothetical protein